MEEHFIGLDRELGSRIGTPAFTKKWGTELSASEVDLLRLQRRDCPAAQQVEAAGRGNMANDPNTSVTVLICAEVVHGIVSAVAAVGSEAARHK